MAVVEVDFEAGRVESKKKISADWNNFNIGMGVVLHSLAIGKAASTLTSYSFGISMLLLAILCGLFMMAFFLRRHLPRCLPEKYVRSILISLILMVYSTIMVELLSWLEAADYFSAVYCVYIFNVLLIWFPIIYIYFGCFHKLANINHAAELVESWQEDKSN